MSAHEHDHAGAAGDHDDSKEHDHAHEMGLRRRLRHRLTPHSHDALDKVDAALEGSREGVRALWVSLLVLMATAAGQAAVVLVSGSVALLGDTLHNLADALTAIPLGIAFVLGRRAATRAFTYGFGRAEDLAGLTVVLVITVSAIVSAWIAVDRLLRPASVTHLAAVAIAGVVGFIGNEIVARYRIAVGRRIGSAALVADGLHARTDGFTSLAVLLAAGGGWLGWDWADPIIGLAITAAIVLVLKDAAKEVFARLLDAVDPTLVDAAEASLRAIPGVQDVPVVRLRWIGHRLHAEAEIVADGSLSLRAAHEIAADAEHQLTHAIPHLARAIVHVDPTSNPGTEHHADLSHARRQH